VDEGPWFVETLTLRLRMKKPHLYFCLLAAVIVSGCVRDHVSYYDRNGDGFVDLEKHHYRVTDSDWQLQDDNYDRRFETKTIFGVGTVEEAVNLPVPKNVPIQRDP
jgi:hypothetical protein